MIDRMADSMLLWYPKIKDLDISQPKTSIVLVTEEEFKQSFEVVPKTLLKKVADAIIKDFNLPVFIRTDQSSGKHDWKNSCFYDNSSPLARNLWGVMEFNHCADLFGLPFKAIIIREFIPMDSKYTAFHGSMPVNPERRYFVKDGKVLCHHVYWFKDCIKNPSVDNWEDLSDKMNQETEQEVKLLTNYACEVSKKVKGYWSIDFCKAKDKRWILIDMATGSHSWHPKECPIKNKFKEERI